MQKYLLLLLLLPATMQAEIGPIKRTLANILCAFFTKGASDETIKEVEAIKAEFSPSSEVEVRSFNKLGEYFFGRCNSLALPLLNHIVLNEDALEELDDKEARRFMIGRTLYKMNRPSLLFFSIWPLLYTYLCRTYNKNQGGEPPLTGEFLDVKDYTSLVPTKKLRLVCLQHILDYPAMLIPAYLSRLQEIKADQETAEQLECAEGGKKVLAYQQSMPHDGTTPGLASTFLPDSLLIKLVEYGCEWAWTFGYLDHPASIAYASALIDTLKFKNPLTLGGYNDRLTSLFFSWKTPHYWSAMPTPDRRLEELSYCAALIKARNKKRDQAQKLLGQ